MPTFRPILLSLRSINWCYVLNVLGLLGISFTLLVAFYYQFWHHELPCPLCLLQRLGLISIGFGFLMNTLFGSSTLHYGLGIVSALLSGLASSRQIFLHIVPGSGSYGSSLFGMHFYTWGLLAALLSLVFIATLLIIEALIYKKPQPIKTPWSSKLVIIIFIGLITANVLSVLIECGLEECPDNPVTYELLQAA